MRQDVRLFIFLALGFVLGGALLGWWLASGGLTPGREAREASMLTQTAQARVLEVLETGELETGGETRTFQVVSIEVLDGPQEGQLFSLEFGRIQALPEGVRLSPGDRLMVSLQPSPEGETVAFFADFIRTQPLALLGVAFVLFVLLVSRWKGLRGLIGMVLSFAVILGFILPQILAGRDPLLVSIVGSALLLAVTLYLVHGWTVKTHTAVVSTVAALVLTGILAAIFVRSTRLSGFGSEETLFLTQLLGQELNVRGLLLGSILIGALGVLDDLIVSQVSVVFELFRADPSKSRAALFRQAMIVGRDHIAATVNTLVLAYVGASLPLLLLFTFFAEPFILAINRELVAEEVVRALVGSLGLMSAVPLTTALAVRVVQRSGTAKGLPAWMGPMTLDEHVMHHHG